MYTFLKLALLIQARHTDRDPQDWQRHRRECVPVSSHQQAMIATPPPAQEQLITVSAILFMPDEG